MTRIIKAEILKYMLEMKNYYPDYVGGFILTLLFFLIFFSKIDVTKDSNEILILVIGFTYWFFSSNSISQMSVSISEEKQVGTFEQLLLKPISIEKILMIRTFCWNFISLIIVMIVYCLSIFIFSIKINFNFNFFLLLLIYFFTLISFIGIAYILASATLVYSKTASFSSIIQYILLFTSGAIIPLDSLPNWVAILAKLIPLSHSINLSVIVLMNKQLQIYYIICFIFLCLFYFFIGLIIFKYSIKKAFVEGINSKF
ncbi:ABC transporter permease [Cetobacterium sp. SF1]|uniref:ABC transporter permease n=1 Tax=unclassified Cetobacterium TaxID=2630983 RepID=UPI003CF224C6